MGDINGSGRRSGAIIKKQIKPRRRAETGISWQIGEGEGEEEGVAD